MKKLTFTIMAAAAVALQYSSAAEPTESESAMPTPEAAPTEAPAAVAPLELKNKSSFQQQEHGRNPFWPIGWKPAPQIAGASTATAEPTSAVDPSAFSVSSIVMDPRAPFAIINGKPMSEGQVFGLQMGGSTYQITVKAIQDGRVILVRGRDQEIVVPLRRR
jgi:hypothetical protein